jgi:hypothetical protein
MAAAVERLSVRNEVPSSLEFYRTFNKKRAIFKYSVSVQCTAVLSMLYEFKVQIRELYSL